MAEAIPLLDTLRGLREPPAPESIAPYLVMTVIGIGAAVLLAVIVRASWQRRRRVRRAAALELALSRGLPPDERLAAQAMLLRRLVRTTAGAAEARHQGAAWLARLDTVFATSFFSQGEGRAYGVSLYSGGAPDVDRLDRSLQNLIAKVRH